MFQNVNFLWKTKGIDAKEGRERGIGSKDRYAGIGTKYMLIFAFCRLNHHEPNILFQCLIQYLIDCVAFAGACAAGDKGVRCQGFLCKADL